MYEDRFTNVRLVNWALGVRNTLAHPGEDKRQYTPTEIQNAASHLVQAVKDLLPYTTPEVAARIRGRSHERPLRAEPQKRQMPVQERGRPKKKDRPARPRPHAAWIATLAAIVLVVVGYAVNRRHQNLRAPRDRAAPAQKTHVSQEPVRRTNKVDWGWLRIEIEASISGLVENLSVPAVPHTPETPTGWYAIACDLGKEVEDTGEKAHTLGLLAKGAMSCGKPDEQKSRLQEAETAALSIMDPADRARCCLFLAEHATQTHEKERRMRLIDIALAAADALKQRNTYYIRAVRMLTNKGEKEAANVLGERMLSKKMRYPYPAGVYEAGDQCALAWARNDTSVFSRNLEVVLGDRVREDYPGIFVSKVDTDRLHLASHVQDHSKEVAILGRIRRASCIPSNLQSYGNSYFHAQARYYARRGELQKAWAFVNAMQDRALRNVCVNHIARSLRGNGIRLSLTEAEALRAEASVTYCSPA